MTAQYQNQGSLLPYEMPLKPVQHLGVSLLLISDPKTSDCEVKFELNGQMMQVRGFSWLDALSSAQSVVEEHFNQVALVFYDKHSRLFSGGYESPHLSDMAFSDVSERLDSHFDRRDGLLCYFRDKASLHRAHELPRLLLQEQFLLELSNELLPGTFVLRHEPVLFHKIQLLPEYSSETYTPDAIRQMLSDKFAELADPTAEMLSLLNRLDALADYQPSATPGWFWKFPLL